MSLAGSGLADGHRRARAWSSPSLRARRRQLADRHAPCHVGHTLSINALGEALPDEDALPFANGWPSNIAKCIPSAPRALVVDTLPAVYPMPTTP